MKPLLLAFLIALAGWNALAQQPQSRTPAAPSATEEFHLRGECANLAVQVEKDTVTSNDAIWSSYYSAKFNRCYVLVSESNSRSGLTGESLYDGQTENILASVEDDRTGKWGMLFNTEFEPDCSAAGDCGYALVQKYINERIRPDDDTSSASNFPTQKALASSTAKPLQALPVASAPPMQRPTPPQSRKDIPAIAKAADGAIVSIVMSDKDGHAIAQGSGFLISKDGIILTNYHVIAEGSSAVAKLPDGALYVVDGVLAFDKARDVAVIKAHGQDFRTLTLGNSDRVQVGEEVVAIGNPLSLESTVSNGIISGIRTAESLGGKFLQITTPISPGSSGGPLFNMAGDVVGITTMYLEGGENLNFAIPINDAKRVLQSESAALQDFPNEPESSKTQQETQDSKVPAYQAYEELLKSNDPYLINATYVCFYDGLERSGLFFVINAHFSDTQTLSTSVEFFEDGVQSKQPLLFKGKPDAFSSKDSVFATLSTLYNTNVDSAHKTDSFEWAPDRAHIKTGFGQPTAGIPIRYELTLQRSTGRFIEDTTMAGITAVHFAGKCITPPNHPSIEENYARAPQPNATHE